MTIRTPDEEDDDGSYSIPKRIRISQEAPGPRNIQIVDADTNESLSRVTAVAIELGSAGTTVVVTYALKTRGMFELDHIDVKYLARSFALETY